MLGEQTQLLKSTVLGPHEPECEEKEYRYTFARRAHAAYKEQVLGKVNDGGCVIRMN